MSLLHYEEGINRNIQEEEAISCASKSAQRFISFMVPDGLMLDNGVSWAVGEQVF